MNVQICLIQNSNKLAILSVDQKSVSFELKKKFLNKIDLFNLELLKEKHIVNNLNRMSSDVTEEYQRPMFSSEDTREDVIYLEGAFKVKHFSVSGNNKMVLLRNDNKVMVYSSISGDNYATISLHESSALGRAQTGLICRV